MSNPNTERDTGPPTMSDVEIYVQRQKHHEFLVTPMNEMDNETKADTVWIGLVSILLFFLFLFLLIWQYKRQVKQ
jgi:hypothetical protein